MEQFDDGSQTQQLNSSKPTSDIMGMLFRLETFIHHAREILNSYEVLTEDFFISFNNAKQLANDIKLLDTKDMMSIMVVKRDEIFSLLIKLDNDYHNW